VAVASTALCAAAPAGASAINLEMSQGAAFNALGHWCGGIKEKVYETGFAASGYPQGNVFMETTCGGSGKGGGGGHTTYGDGLGRLDVARRNLEMGADGGHA